MIANYSRILSIVLVSIVVVVLLSTGPVRAFFLSIGVSNEFPILGEVIHFTTGATVEENEQIRIESFLLELTGPTSRTCEFTTDGVPISGCDGINIALLESPLFNGYGYGYYEPGMFRFNISLNTSLLNTGKYQATLTARTPNGPVLSDMQDLTVLNLLNSISSCSVRARNGVVLFNGLEHTKNNRVNLNVPLNNANDGSGSLTVQDRKKRINFEFQINQARRATNQFIVFDVTGLIKEDRLEEVPATARILFDTQSLKLHVISPQIAADTMEVNFARC